MKEPSPTYVITSDQAAQLLRALDEAVKAVEEAVGYIVRTQELAKEAQARGNPH